MATLTINGDTTFAVNDILRIKDGMDDEWMQVTAVNGNTYTITRDLAGQYASNNNPIWKKGTSVTNFGVSGDGGIYLTSSESNAPYLSVVTHAGSPWSALTTHLRLGNLNGFLGYSTDKYGIAIGEANKYLKYDPTNGLRIKGDITVTGGDAFSKSTDDLDDITDGATYNKTTVNEVTGAGRAYNDIDASGNYIGAINPAHVAPISGAGLYLGSDYLGYYDSSNWKTYMDSSGNFYLGGSGGDLQWNGTTLSITGVITCSATSSYVGNSIGTSYTAAKCTDANADQTSAHDCAHPGDYTASHTAADTTLVNGVAAATVEEGGSKAHSWRHASDVTKIDGGDIYTNTVTATQITVANLAAINADLGTITAGAMSGITIAIGTGNSIFKADSNGIYLGNATFASAPFRVSMAGALTATTGDFLGTVNVGSAGKVYIDGANEVIKVYDASSNLIVELGKLA